MRVVAGLPDGGVVAAGSSVLIVREAPGARYEYAAQPIQGIALALAPFRQADGRLRTYVSVAPPASGRIDVGGSPPGDGELLRETDGGWQDASGSQFAGNEVSGDGSVKNDPVLAVASSSSGDNAWAVGGYAGTDDAAGQGTREPLSSPAAREWMSASIWRYEAAGGVRPPALATATPSLPAQAGSVAFAFFSSAMCKVQCSAVPDAQPDVNLSTAASQIAAYARQPGGPAFAMLGGNARGPVPGLSGQSAAKTAIDFAHLPSLLAPLSGVPTFAALGSHDNVRGQADETQPWAEAFAEAPAPFGSSSAPGITPVASGGAAPNGLVHLFYAFDAHQNGATLRVVVLDNSKGSLEESAAGQTRWLEEVLDASQREGVPVVAVTALPLHGPSFNGIDEARDGNEVAALLARRRVLAVFAASQLDERHLVPEVAAAGVPQIPEYEGASLGYQQHVNDGVKWYYVTVNTRAAATQSSGAVSVSAIPVLASLSLKPLDGLSVARSLTLRFEAIGRRPAGTLATKFAEDHPFPGYDDYVGIPAPECGEKGSCVRPSYTFASSDPTIGDFVAPTGPGSQFPQLDAAGHPVPSSSSGLFCAYNSGTTTVSITAGLLSYSLPVTVRAGGFGSPCGTVYRPGVGNIVILHNGQTQSRLSGAAAPPPPAPALSGTTPPLSLVPPPPAAPAPVAPPAPSIPAAPSPVKPPAPVAPPAFESAPPPLVETVGVTPAILPAATPPVEPIPPGASGYAQSPSAAKRREEARKHASQSAFSLRPAGTLGAEWFYAAAAVTTILALMLVARSLPARPRTRPALLLDRPLVRDRRTRKRGSPP